MNKSRKNQRGIVLFIALFLFIVLLIAAVIILLTASNYSTFAGGQVRKIQAYALAEAGINYAYWQLRTNMPASFPYTINTIPPINIPAGFSIEIVIDNDTLDPARYKIDSKVTYPKVKAQP